MIITLYLHLFSVVIACVLYNEQEAHRTSRVKPRTFGLVVGLLSLIPLAMALFGFLWWAMAKRTTKKVPIIPRPLMVWILTVNISWLFYLLN